MLLLIQFGLAVVAGFRGWGTLPLGLLMLMFLGGMALFAVGVSEFSPLFLIMDFGLAIVLAYMAIVPREPA